jgi:parvulin-like peptidyl-prolyl isomerase
MHASSDLKTRGRMIGVLLILVIMGNAGCGKKYKSSLTDDEYRRILARTKPVPASTLLVSSEEVTTEDIASSPVVLGNHLIPLDKYLSPVAETTDPNAFKEIARPQIESSLDTQIENIILYQKAKTEAGDKIDEDLKKKAEQEWRKFVLEHEGNEAKAEEVLQQASMTREQFKESRKRMILSRYHVYNQVPSDRPISHPELIEYYEKMRDEFFAIKPKITFRLIDIDLAKLTLTDMTLDRNDQALTLAQDLHKQLKAGADFAKLAKEYSHGFSRNAGGLWKARDPKTLAPPYDVLGQACETLELGQIADPIEARDHVFLLKLEAKQEQGYQPLAEVQPQVQAKIIADRRLEATKKLDAELKDRAAAGQTDAFIDVCADEIYQKESGK